MIPAFPFSQPTPAEPEPVHAAYRHAVHCWLAERHAHLILDGICAAPHLHRAPAIRAAQVQVAQAEDATGTAVERYIATLRTTRDVHVPHPSAA